SVTTSSSRITHTYYHNQSCGSGPCTYVASLSVTDSRGMQSVNGVSSAISVNSATSPTPTPTPSATPTPTPTPTPSGQVSQVVSTRGATQTVSMSTATAGARICNPTDNTSPTHIGATATGTTQVYTAPVTVGRCSQIFCKALAYKAVITDSVVTSYNADYSN